MSSNKTHPWTFKASWWFLPITYPLLFLLLMLPQCWTSSHPPGLAEPLSQFHTHIGTFQILYMWAEQRDLIHNTRTGNSLRRVTSSPRGFSQSCGNWIGFLNFLLPTDPLPHVGSPFLTAHPSRAPVSISWCFYGQGREGLLLCRQSGFPLPLPSSIIWP